MGTHKWMVCQLAVWDTRGCNSPTVHTSMPILVGNQPSVGIFYIKGLFKNVEQKNKKCPKKILKCHYFGIFFSNSPT